MQAVTNGELIFHALKMWHVRYDPELADELGAFRYLKSQ